MTPDVRGAYSLLAPTFNMAGASWNGPVAKRLVELAALEPGQLVLDVGCGTGTATIHIAEAVRPGGHVIAVDSAEPMLDRARQTAKGLRNVGFRCADATDLPFRKNSFDAVIASLVAYLLDDPADAITQWRGLVEPAGLVAYSWVLSEDPVWLPVYQAVDAFVPEGRQRWVEFTSRPPWDTVAHAQALATGFGSVRTVAEPVITLYDNPAHWWKSSWSQGPFLFWQYIPEWQRAAARAEAMRAIKVLLAEHGKLSRTRTVCYTLCHTRATLP